MLTTQNEDLRHKAIYPPTCSQHIVALPATEPPKSLIIAKLILPRVLIAKYELSVEAGWLADSQSGSRQETTFWPNLTIDN